MKDATILVLNAPFLLSVVRHNLRIDRGKKGGIKGWTEGGGHCCVQTGS